MFLTDQLVIAPLQAEQINEICRLADEQLGRGYLSASDLSREGLHTLVASQAGTVLGFVTCEILAVKDLQQRFPELFDALPASFQAAKQLGKIGSLVVAKSLHRQGIGTQLMTAVLQLLRKEVRHVFLLGWRSAQGTNIQQLALKLGFESQAVLSDYWKTASLTGDYACPVCGAPPCRCSAVIFCKIL
jgi:ribosomal protein S18 acetylase RimI-like enzyme